MNELFEMGYRAGWARAARCLAEIRNTKDTERLGAIAGIELQNTRALSQESDVSTDSWARGFFDGFLSHADEYR